jgi:threonine dehydratase
LLNNKEKFYNKTVAVIISGGNISIEQFCELTKKRGYKI